jgi:hypothetical protein
MENVMCFHPKLGFVGQRIFMLIEVRTFTLAPKVPRSYNTRNIPRPNENQKSPMASCSTSVTINSSREHVDHLGDTKDEVEEWSEDHDD